MITFELEKAEAELVLAALAKQPYEAVSGLIQKLLEQGNRQLSSEAPAEPAAE